MPLKATRIYPSTSSPLPADTPIVIDRWDARYSWEDVPNGPRMVWNENKGTYMKQPDAASSTQCSCSSSTPTSSSSSSTFTHQQSIWQGWSSWHWQWWKMPRWMTRSHRPSWMPWMTPGMFWAIMINVLAILVIAVVLFVVLLKRWRRDRREERDALEKEEDKDEDEDALAPNPNDDDTLASDKADWRQIRSRLLLYGDLDQAEEDECREKLAKIILQQDRCAERRAGFAVLWFGWLAAGWGGITTLCLSKRWLWGGTLMMIIWLLFMLLMGKMVVFVWLREDRAEFPPAIRPKGGWGALEFESFGEFEEVGYPTLERARFRMLHVFIWCLRNWILDESYRRDVERQRLYRYCLNFRDAIEFGIAERRETSDSNERILGEFYASPIEDVVGVSAAIGDARVPVLERVDTDAEGSRRRKGKEVSRSDKPEISTRVTRSKAAHSIALPDVVEKSRERVTRSKHTGRNAWTSKQMRDFGDLRK